MKDSLDRLTCDHISGAVLMAIRDVGSLRLKVHSSILWFGALVCVRVEKADWVVSTHAVLSPLLKVDATDCFMLSTC